MIGILAYGSLIDDPGDEIEPLVIEKIDGVKTPFAIEFARKSSTRDNAPTLIPVSQGGAKINATILKLEEGVSESDAMDMLWRRETRRIGSGLSYTRDPSPGPDTVMIEKVTDFEGLEVVLYTKIGSNIDNLTPQTLSELAINSAKGDVGKDGKDGIAYLISAKQNNIQTPLMPEYEQEILRLTDAETLEQALDAIVNP